MERVGKALDLLKPDFRRCIRLLRKGGAVQDRQGQLL